MSVRRSLAVGLAGDVWLRINSLFHVDIVICVVFFNKSNVYLLRRQGVLFYYYLVSGAEICIHHFYVPGHNYSFDNRCELYVWQLMCYVFFYETKLY